ncbi:hypothetical protein Dimus_005068 [Dionaea muscipula]
MSLPSLVLASVAVADASEPKGEIPRPWLDDEGFKLARIRAGEAKQPTQYALWLPLVALVVIRRPGGTVGAARGVTTLMAGVASSLCSNHNAACRRKDPGGRLPPLSTLVLDLMVIIFKDGRRWFLLKMVRRRFILKMVDGSSNEEGLDVASFICWAHLFIMMMGIA